MTPTLRVVLIVVSILTTFMIMRKIRQSKLQIEDSIFWLGFSSILIVFSIFPGCRIFWRSWRERTRLPILSIWRLFSS